MSMQWEPDDLVFTYAWAAHLPPDDKDRFLTEVNGYLVEHHGYTAEWGQLIASWRATADYWHDHPDEALALVEVIGGADRTVVCTHCRCELRQGDGATYTWYGEDNSVSCPARWFAGFHVPEYPDDDNGYRTDSVTVVEPPANGYTWSSEPSGDLYIRIAPRVAPPPPPPPVKRPLWYRTLRELARPMAGADWIVYGAMLIVLCLAAEVGGPHPSVLGILGWIAADLAAGAGAVWAVGLRKARKERKHGRP